MRAPLPLLLVLLLVAPGCLSSLSGTPGATPAPSPAGLDGLGPQGAAKVVVDPATGARSFLYEGQAQADANAALVASGVSAKVWTWPLPFDVDARVGGVDANLTWAPDPLQSMTLLVRVRDELGRLQCGGAGSATQAVSECSSPVPANATRPARWSVEVTAGLGATQPGTPFALNLTLVPAAAVRLGELAAGTDPTIRMEAMDTGLPGSEDNIGVLPSGAIFVQQDTRTLKSTDDGRTWKDVAPPTTGTRTLDPMLAVDPWSKTVYVDQLYVGCSVLAWSTDEGATWLSNPAACGFPVDDHQKLAVGANALGLPLNDVYYTWGGIGYGGVWASSSHDGGATFAPTPVAGVGDGWSPRTSGATIADRKGDVYVPMYLCDDGVAVGVSNDHGRTFSVHPVSREPFDCTNDVDPGVAVDAANVAYAAFWRASGVQYSFSADQGRTWSAPLVVSPPGLRSFVHVDAVAGDAGRLAIAYTATPDSAKGANLAEGWSRWGLYVAFVENATSAHPIVRTALVGQGADLVQRGPICMGGISCQGGDRNLLDFIDVAVGPDGRVYVSYADGCKDPCPTPADSRRAEGMVAVERDGPRLFAGRPPWG